MTYWLLKGGTSGPLSIFGFFLAFFNLVRRFDVLQYPEVVAGSKKI